MDLSRSTRTKEEVVRIFRTEEILDATRRVIARDGLADASMERIASEARVAKGTLYLYFESREALLARACGDVVSELLRRTRGAVERTRGVRRKLEQTVRIGLEHSTEHRTLLRALEVEGRLGSSLGPAPTRKELAAYLGLISGLIERGVRGRTFRRVDSHWAARCLLGMMRMAMLEDGRDAPAAETTAEEIVDFLIQGIGTGERR